MAQPLYLQTSGRAKRKLGAPCLVPLQNHNSFKSKQNRSLIGVRVMSAKSKASRKRGRVEDEGSVNGGESDEVAFWKKNYNEMKQLKEEAERDLQQEKSLRSNNEGILKDSLEIVKEVQSKSKEEKEKKAKAATDSSSSTSPAESAVAHAQDNERLLKIISFYETMTSMTVKMKEDDRYKCTVKNPGTRQAAQFYISTSTVEGELLYEPAANAELFPGYMNEEALSFVPEMGPVLLGDAIASMFVDDDESGEEEEESEEEEN